MPSHLEEILQRDINTIRKNVIEMGALVERAIEDSLQTLQDGDAEKAYSVILRDRYIDEMETVLDRLCQEFLVRHQPVAGNLRMVYAVIKIINELERIGDYAESIARQYLELSDVKFSLSFEKFYEIANLAIPMCKNAVQSFKDQDTDIARATMAMEKDVDDLRHQIHTDLVELQGKKKLPAEALPPLMIISSRYERMADQACNICEEVLYMCTGANIKHESKPEIKVLFVDEHDAIRGPIAEGIANSLGLEGFSFKSAGIQPAPAAPDAVKFMADKGIDLEGQGSKYLHQVMDLESYSVVVALCKEGEKAFPDPPTKTVSIRWDVRDLSKVTGTEEEKKKAYEETYNYLEKNITNLVKAIRGNNLKK